MTRNEQLRYINALATDYYINRNYQNRTMPNNVPNNFAVINNNQRLNDHNFLNNNARRLIDLPIIVLTDQDM